MDGFFEHLLFDVDMSHDGVDAAVAEVIFSQYGFIHLERLLKQFEGIISVPALHIAAAKESQDVGVVLLRLLMTRD